MYVENTDTLTQFYFSNLDAWMKILEPMESQRKETNRVKLFPAHITGEVRMFNKTTNCNKYF